MLAQMQAQSPTVGLLEVDLDLVSDGYVLFCPNLSSNFYLINNCGEKINEWETDLSSELKIGYLDEDGNLLILNGRNISKYDWDGNLIWRFSSSDYNIQAHHDFEVMPNGNILTIGRKNIPYDEAIELGFQAEDLSDSLLRIDGLYEFKHIDNNDFELVWKWNFKDHLVQGLSDTINNYGDIAASPRKLNIHYGNFFQSIDWLHCNGVNYNEVLDQVIVSSRNTSEIYIIDHSTTIAEAASSSGGDQGYGGDFLWRWGSENLMNQHDPNWIPNSHPNGGMISVFNNIESTIPFHYSSIKIIDPQLDAQGKYQLDSLYQFLPLEEHHLISGQGHEIFSPFMSGGHSQSNGNFIMISGNYGEYYELTSEGALAWKYQNPVGIQAQIQFTTPQNVSTFNIKKYPLDFAGFIGKNLNPQGLIENENSISEECILKTDVNDINKFDLTVFPNPSFGDVYFQSEDQVEQVRIFALSGRKIAQINNPVHSINIPLQNGSYIFQFHFNGKLVNKLVNITP